MNNYIKDEDCSVSLGGLHMIGIRPIISHDWHGLIRSNEDEYILFEEDDGHYWDVVRLSETTRGPLYYGLCELRETLTTKTLCRYKFRKGIPKIKSPHFNLHYDIKNRFVELITIEVNNEKIEVHPHSLIGLIDCLSFKKNKKYYEKQ